jgi:lipopolysaccharide transport system ATP-binding protein
MSRFAVVVENLGKRYQLGRALRPVRHRPESDFLWALRDVAFEVRPGEVVGIIGRNGSGKSTLLKILSRVVTPTTGQATIAGRVGSLLEVGTGFHPELTGRENVYLNGAILGMSRRDVRRQFDEIVAFADVARFLDTPVKRYSSGMYVRLAFAVAAHLDPEVLIVDEVLAVGDVDFQKKCLGKMDRVAKSGRTILFVSHNMQAVSTLTTRTVLLDAGRLTFDGPTSQAIGEYLQEEKSPAAVYTAEPSLTEPRVTRIALRTTYPNNVQVHGQPLVVEIDVHTPTPLKDAGVSFQIFNDLRQPALHLWTFDSERPLCRRPGTYRLICRIPNLRLYMGRYTLTVHFVDPEPLRGVCPFELVMYGHARGNAPSGEWCLDSCAYIEDCDWQIVAQEAASPLPCHA